VACAEQPAQVAQGRTIDDPGSAANIVGTRFPAMSLVKWGFIGLFLLRIAEMAAFVAVALAIGWIPAACLFLATSILGLLILRRSGRSDIDRFREAFRRDGIRAIHLESPGLGPILGGILLVFPGFITDALGALLLIPAIRRKLRGLIARARDARQRQREPSIVDLTPKEWHQVSDKPIKNGGPRKRVRS
jgi:UPF0716 family protein affecting phage T7 exclusion